MRPPECTLRTVLIKYTKIIVAVLFPPLYVMMGVTALQGASWKPYYKDPTGNNGYVSVYDPDSIHYPYKKKGLLGTTTVNKGIVGVWVAGMWVAEDIIDPHQALYEMNCASRSYRIRLQVLGDKEFSDPWVSWKPIRPGSEEEALYKKVCGWW
jgi:hypothetical protein